MEVRADGFKDELKNRTALLGASGDRRPDPFEPRRPVSLREPWVMCRSMTTKRIACSAKLLVGSMPGVVINLM